MKNLLSRGKSAFTLVEILVVVAIIAILGSVTFGLISPVQNVIRESRAKAQLDKITIALNDFRSTYGEYPMPEGSVSKTEWEKLLIQTMRGDKILARRNSQMRLLDYNDNRPKAEKKPFLSLSDFTLDEEDIDAATQILDPWDNPFQYRYNYISGGKPAKLWNSPTFLLISAGAEFNEPATTEDFFTKTMEKDGIVELDIDSDNYYFEGVRTDNITNF